MKGGTIKSVRKAKKEGLIKMKDTLKAIRMDVRVLGNLMEYDKRLNELRDLDNMRLTYDHNYSEYSELMDKKVAQLVDWLLYDLHVLNTLIIQTIPYDNFNKLSKTTQESMVKDLKEDLLDGILEHVEK